MSRRLSDMEWATFQDEVNVSRFYFPAWGGVVNWRGMLILVFKGANGELFTTDISDAEAWIANVQWKQDPLSGAWWSFLPQETAGVLANWAADNGHLLDDAGDLVVDLAEKIGQAAGGVVGPLTIPLIAAAVLAVMVLRK